MSPRIRGWTLAVVQMIVMCAVGGRYVADRARYPHGWAHVVPADPDLPIRGRYLALAVEADARDNVGSAKYAWVQVSVEGDRVVAHVLPAEPARAWSQTAIRGSTPTRARLTDPVAFYVPEHADVPALGPNGPDLWVEVTVPPDGSVRPLRLGVMRDGAIEPLSLE